MDVEWLPEVDSTNAELVRRAAAGAVGDGTVVATTRQTAGRGRQGRTWTAPADTTIAVSVYFADTRGAGWLPLLAGLAMTRAVRSLIPGREVSLKWPNDVHVRGRKVSGLLGELVPGGGVVMGAGLNLTMTEEQLPVPTATFLALEGVALDDLVERALSAYLDQLAGAWTAFSGSGFDPEAGLRASVSAVCATLGRDVRVELPDGSTVLGVAESIDEAGRLVVADGVRRLVVAAGDVTHLRHR